jgi:predicted nucleotidyltransferase
MPVWLQLLWEALFKSRDARLCVPAWGQGNGKFTYICKKKHMDIKLLYKIQTALAQEPVLRAWLFGSFARNEETTESDIDILVQFMPDAKISLFDYGGIIYKLEETTGYRVDLVEEHMLKPFARATVEHDKKLIYERKTT